MAEIALKLSSIHERLLVLDHKSRTPLLSKQNAFDGQNLGKTTSQRLPAPIAQRATER